MITPSPITTNAWEQENKLLKFSHGVGNPFGIFLGVLLIPCSHQAMQEQVNQSQCHQKITFQHLLRLVGFGPQRLTHVGGTEKNTQNKTEHNTTKKNQSLNP